MHSVRMHLGVFIMLPSLPSSLPFRGDLWRTIYMHAYLSTMNHTIESRENTSPNLCIAMGTIMGFSAAALLRGRRNEDSLRGSPIFCSLHHNPSTLDK